MTDPLDQLDAQLREAGDKWRAGRKAPVDRVNSAVFASTSVKRDPIRVAVSLGAVFAVVVVALLIIVSLPPRTNQIATGSPSPSASSSPQASTPQASSQATSSVIPPTTEPSAMVTSQPTTGAELNWQEVDSSKLPTFDQGFDTVNIQDGKFAVTGERCDGLSVCEYDLYESGDGEAWTKMARIAPDVGQVRGLQLTHDDRFGYLAAASQLYKGPGAGLWHSSDGQNWDWLGGQDAFDVTADCGSRTHDATDVYNIYRAATGLVAMGRIYCEEIFLHAAWASEDGTTWQRIDPLPVDQVFESNGHYVGIQHDIRKSQLWFSGDGRTWQQNAIPERSMSIGTTASGFVAVDSANSSGALTFLASPDGVTWTALGPPQVGQITSQPNTDGTRTTFSDFNGELYVSSTDGLSWDRFQLPGAATDNPGDAAILGNRLFAWTYGSGPAWVADIPDVVAPPPPPSIPASSPNSSPASNGDLTIDPSLTKSVLASVDPVGDGSFSQDGPLVAFTTSSWKDLEVANLETGTLTDVAQAHGDEQIVWVDLSGTRVAWEIGQWSGNKDLTPCSTQGTLTWTIYARDLAGGSDQKVADGTNSDVNGCSAMPLPIAIDGNTVAYVTETPRPDAPHATTVVFWSTDSGQTLRTIESDVTVGDLDMSDGNVAYIEGTPSKDIYGWLDQAKLILDHGDGSDPVFVTTGPETVSLSGGRLAWTSYPPTNWLQIWTNTVADPAIHQVFGDAPDVRSDEAYAAGNFVTYATNDGLKLWDGTTQTTHSISVYPETGGVPIGTANVVSANGGWLVWSGTQEVGGQIVESIAGLPLIEVPGLGQ